MMIFSLCMCMCMCVYFTKVTEYCSKGSMEAYNIALLIFFFYLMPFKERKQSIMGFEIICYAVMLYS